MKLKNNKIINSIKNRAKSNQAYYNYNLCPKYPRDIITNNINITNIYDYDKINNSNLNQNNTSNYYSRIKSSSNHIKRIFNRPQISIFPNNISMNNNNNLKNYNYNVYNKMSNLIINSNDNKPYISCDEKKYKNKNCNSIKYIESKKYDIINLKNKSIDKKLKVEKSNNDICDSNSNNQNNDFNLLYNSSKINKSKIKNYGINITNITNSVNKSALNIRPLHQIKLNEAKKTDLILTIINSQKNKNKITNNNTNINETYNQKMKINIYSNLNKNLNNNYYKMSNKIKNIDKIKKIFIKAINKEKLICPNSSKLNLHSNSGICNISINKKLDKTNNTNEHIISTYNNTSSPLFQDYYAMEEQNIEYRKEMEDFHTVITNFDLFNNNASSGDLTTNTNNNNIFGNSLSYFSIFDGHSGAIPSKYCKENFHKLLHQNLIQYFNSQASNSYQYISTSSHHYSHLNHVQTSKPTSEDPIPSILSSTFTQVQSNLSTLLTPKEKYMGTTATIIILMNNKTTRTLYCANVGDSSCYIITKSTNSDKKFECKKLSIEHNCLNLGEVNRIKNNGGIVFNGRVFGTLMLTRSIGDIEMKNYGVICTPDVVRRDIGFNEEGFIVIASDGLWEGIQDDKLEEVVQGFDEGAQCFCKRMVEKAIKEGSRDNITCIVIKL